MAARLRVVFAYRPRKRGHGSRIMRVDQLSAMATAHLGDRYEFSTRELFQAGQPRRQRQALQALSGAVVIFLKGSGYCFDEAGLERLKAETRGICIDHLDSVFGVGPIFPLADVHILSSHAAMRQLEPHFASGHVAGEAALLTHHADPRIFGTDHTHASDLRPGYFGRSINTVFLASLGNALTGNAEYREDFAGVPDRMAEANLHWAVRAPGWRGDLLAFKPFTKGFNAAWAGANVIADRAEDDAIEYLGEDYPYLSENSSDDALLEVMKRAESGVGARDWRLAINRMSDVRRRTAPPVIMAELDAILKRFL